MIKFIIITFLMAAIFAMAFGSFIYVISENKLDNLIKK